MLIRNVLPYWDPVARRRVRQVARSLAPSDPWPGDDATSEEVAGLVLLRLLWLQRQAHRAGQLRQVEATMLLARAAVEACIAGLYWLDVDSAAVRLGGGNARALQSMLSYLADGDLLDRELLSDAVAALGEPKPLPDLRTMADSVVTRTNEMFAGDIYRRVYIPLSTFVPHPTGVALLQHVRMDGSLSEAPARMWSTRAALHATDVCVAELAMKLAERTGGPAFAFRSYASVHMSRTVAPVVAVAARRARQTVSWTKLPSTLQAIIELRRYYLSGEAAHDCYRERRAATARVLAQGLELLASDIPGDVRALLINRVADAIAKQNERDTCPDPTE